MKMELSGASAVRFANGVLGSMHKDFVGQGKIISASFENYSSVAETTWSAATIKQTDRMQNHVTLDFLASQGFSKNFENRFWSKVNRKGPIPPHRIRLGRCWTWMGYKDDQGRGSIGYGGSRKGMIRAHQASWILNCGPIQKGLCICHHCDNPTCVRPKHLFCGTQKQNIQDAITKGRFSFRPHLPGEDSAHHKLNESDVLKIRALYKPGTYSYRKLASRFGITPTHVGYIVKRKNWKHV